MSSLSSETAWKRRFVRAAIVAALAGTAGAVAFGTARLVKPSAANASATTVATEPEPSATADVSSRSPATESASPRASATTTTSAVESATTASASAPRTSASVSTQAPQTSSTEPAKTPETRRVTFTVIPLGAIFELDGRLETWAGREFPLRVGSTHTVRITMPPGAKCCEPLDTGFTVTAPPADAPDAVLPQAFRLKTRPATVQLVGGPAGAMAMCPIGAVGSVPVSVNVSAPTWTGHCEFTPGGGTQTVVIRAGETNTISWP